MNENKTDRQELLMKIQKNRFCLIDLSLYLDSHKDDKEAMAMFQKCGREYLDAKKEYVAQFGPLTHGDIIGKGSWSWVKAPWPWEMEV